jgi:leucyl aminopeptidase
MLKFKIEKWNKQKPELLGLLEDDEPLYLMEKDEKVLSWIKKLKDKKVKKDIVADNYWIGWTGLFENYDWDEKCRILAKNFYSAVKANGHDHAGFLLNTSSAIKVLPFLLEGLCLGSYRFDKYKSKEKEEKNTIVTFYVLEKDTAPCHKILSQTESLFKNINACRDMINEPGNVLFPSQIVQIAKSVSAKTPGLSCEVISAGQLKQKGYTGLLQIGKGSEHPPWMVVVKYHPKNKSPNKHLALVGKGVTFDSGGLCLKPPADMWEMKTDMAGAATVLYAIASIAQKKIPLQVTAILCIAENLPDGKAFRPGDIFKAKNGKTIHVANTDAEGRLALTDGLFRAGEEKATHVVDIATLTGACVVALGNNVTGLFSNRSDFRDLFIKAADKTGEKYWELPMHHEYEDLLKNPYADINNVGSRDGGAIQAALFLKEFVPQNTSWIHLDIAGPSFTAKPWKYYAEGATAVGLRTFVNLAEAMSKKEYF